MNTYIEIVDLTAQGHARLKIFFSEHGKPGLIDGKMEDACRRQCLAQLEDRLNDDLSLSWELIGKYTASGEAAIFEADADDFVTRTHTFDFDEDTEFTYAPGEDTTLIPEA